MCFQLRLALALGCRTLHELYTGEPIPMTAADLALWEAYYAAEPWGAMQQAVGLGTIAATLANQHRKKGATPFKASDLYPALAKIAERKQGVNTVALKAGFSSMKARQRERRGKPKAEQTWPPASAN